MPSRPLPPAFCTHLFRQRIPSLLSLGDSQFHRGLQWLFLGCLLFSGLGASAALVDVWRAEDLNLNEGDAVGTWTSASNRVANGASGEQPTMRLSATPAGTKVVRFNGAHRMSVANSPAGGRTAFSMAIVFKASAAGVNDNAQWWGKSGLVDAEEPGVTSDWGTVLSEGGQVGIGTGNGDVSTYSSGASLVDGTYHAAVFTWGGGSQTVFVDGRAPVAQAGVSTAVRNNNGISLGGIRTGEANRRFNGDIAEIRFYDTALTSLEASNVIQDLRDIHVFGNLPRIRSFTATTNQIYLGASVVLSWDVSNATSVVIAPGIGAVSGIGSSSVSPTTTTTYTLSATNPDGGRTNTVTVTVDPGVPLASNYSTNTPRNTAVAITLRGTDPQGSNLVYSIVTPPAHGLLGGSPPNVTYTPTTDFDGLDSFTFKVNDGMFDSAPGSVSINVVPPPTEPTGIILSSTNFSSSAGPGSFIAALRAVDPNLEDSHTFLLVPGFGDNAQFVVQGNLLNAGPTFTGGSGAVRTVRLRVTDNTGRTFEQTFSLHGVDTIQNVVINEIHYNPDYNPIRESFIELHNPTGAPIDVSLWRVRGGIDFFLPAGTSVPAYGFLVVGEDPSTLFTRYAINAMGPWSGGLNNEGEEVTLRDAGNNLIDRVDYSSEFPWPIAANGNGSSAQLINPSLDNDLGSSWSSGLPTPAGTNSVFALNAAPNIRQVDHSPNAPRSTNQVLMTAKVTDPEGVGSVTLAYQLVAPGQFIPSTLPLTSAQLNALITTPATNAPNPAFEAPANWISVAMRDDGLSGDQLAGDGIYSVLLPPQANRTLVRYRITVVDLLGASRRAPFADDPSLNFAYFVYDGVPAYQSVSAAALQTIPIYTLITRDPDINQATAWFNGTDQLPQANGNGTRNEGRLVFNWEGAFVYEGKVYDHVTYRLRGANGRYHPGKRSFRFRFRDGRLFEPRDVHGERYPTKWREVTTGKGQSNRGSETYALNEVVNYFIFNKVGVPAPSAHHFHFRVVRGAQETPADPYAGDFWGLNWAQEKYDVNFLESHGLPKGNLYKLVDNFVLGEDERRYQAPFGPTNSQDFFNLENNLTGFQSIPWLLAHANYTNWYRYFTIAEAIRHYDIWPSANKNGAWYFEPLYGASNSFLGRVMQLPYDTTDTWGPTWNTGEDILFNGIFPSSQPGGDAGQHPELQLEYRNTVREIRALLFQPDQINAVIDAHAGVISAVAPADLARWLNAPAPGNYASLLIGGTPGVTGGLAGEAQDMKNFMFVGGNNGWWVDRNAVGAGGWVTRLDTVATDAAVPVRPTITYVGTNGFPADGLVFQSSAFSDPQGAGTFAAMQWRVAEVLAPGTAVTHPAQLRLEWDASWTSPEFTAFGDFVTIPDFAVQPEHVYRARVRHKDNTGRWSAWSLPVEFRPGARDTVGQLRTNLVIAEVMYNPPGEGATDGDEFEFLELRNTGATTLNLGGLSFTAGINFSFTNGTTLVAGGTFLLARNPAVLATRYPGVVVNGIFTGKLNNDGETLTISHAVAGEIVSLTYGDRAPWPVTANGYGFSLVFDATSGTYRASAARFGTPGIAGGISAIGGVVINEVLSSSTFPSEDSIELLNSTGTNVDISGWFLTDDPTLPQKFRIPAGPALAPGAYRVFTEDDFNPTPGIGVSFSLSSLGDDVYLFSADTAAQLTGYSHGFAFGAAQDAVSFGRYINSVGEEQLPLQISPTPGGANAGPRVGPVTLSEIHYHPRNIADEFLELRNITGSVVLLYDPAVPTNTWKVSGLGFSFPQGVSVPAQGCILLVSDSPAAFRARWNVPVPVQIFQYTSGSLQDSGENIEIQAPDAPTPGGVPYYAVDTVRYNDRGPWPAAADGAGASLQRVDSAVYGNDPINWVAATPSPGTHGLTGTPPSLTSQPSSRTNASTSTASFTTAATGSNPLFYQWRFKNDNIEGATNATLVLANVQLADSGTYSALVFNSAGSDESAGATLLVRIGPGITSNPTNVTLRVRPDPLAAPITNASFFVSASSFNPPLRYQWRVNGGDLPGETNSMLTITNVQLTNEGAYTVIITDGVGPISSAPAMLIPLISPIVVVPPASQTVVAGGSVTLSALVTGNPLPTTFEWRRTTSPASLMASNSVNERFNFFTVPGTNPPGTVAYRLVVKNLANFQPGVAANFSITTLADSDADRIPDTWETQYFLSATGADPDTDSDNDRLTNRQEYEAGTNPTNDNSFLELNLNTSLAQPLLTFGAVSNKTYSIQFTDDLNVSPWSKLADMVARPTNRVETVIDPTWTTNRFYRAVTPAQP